MTAQWGIALRAQLNLEGVDMTRITSLGFVCALALGGTAGISEGAFTSSAVSTAGTSYTHFGNGSNLSGMYIHADDKQNSIFDHANGYVRFSRGPLNGVLSSFDTEFGSGNWVITQFAVQLRHGNEANMNAAGASTHIAGTLAFHHTNQSYGSLGGLLPGDAAHLADTAYVPESPGTETVYDLGAGNMQLLDDLLLSSSEIVLAISSADGARAGFAVPSVGTQKAFLLITAEAIPNPAASMTLVLASAIVAARRRR